MKTYVISLPEARTRRDNASVQLGRAGVSFEFFDAISGETALREHFDGYDEYRFAVNTGRVVNLGEIGCYASHVALWKRCIAAGQTVMILEDDFNLVGDFAGAVKHVTDLTDEYGFIRLQSERRAKKRLVKELENFQLWCYTKAPHSTMCYAISPTVAKRFVSDSTTFSAPVDVYMKRFWEHGHLMYGLTPYTVTESEASSDSSVRYLHIPVGRHEAQQAVRKRSPKTLTLRLHRAFTKLSWWLNRQRFNFDVRSRKKLRIK